MKVDWLTYSELQTPILEISHLSEQAFVYDIYSQLKETFSWQKYFNGRNW
nr:hypothetical protein [Mycoplasmopsis bovis]